MPNNNQIEINKLYNKLLPSITKLLNKYNYLEILPEEKEELIKKFLLEIIKNNKILDSKIYIKELEIYIDNYINKTIKKNKKGIMIINSYIDKQISLKTTPEENLIELINLSEFLEKYEFTITPDICVEIIKTNEILSKILEQIVQEFIQTSKENEIIYNNSIIMSLLDIYCMLNNIELDSYADKELDEHLLDELDKQTKDSLLMYFQEINKPILTEEEERELAKRVSEGDESAKTKLIEHNLKWVVRIAKRYIGRGLEILDLIQEGNIGLMVAIDKFDYTKGYRLSTYSYHWIRQSITRAITDKARLIRLPKQIDEKTKKYQQKIRELEQMLNRTATKQEIINELNIDLKELDEVYAYMQDITSLNAIIDNKDSSELEILLESNEDTPEESYIKKDLLNEIIKIFKNCCLEEKEIKVLLLRNGFFGKVLTLAKVGEVLGGLTRERVRQIESKALKKIRMSPYISNLIEYANNPSEALKNLSTSIEFYATNSKSTKSFQKKGAIKEIETILIQQEELIPHTNKEENQQLPLTIFDTFIDLGYTKEEILSILSELPPQDKKRVALRNGPDLDNPVLSRTMRERDRRLYITLTLPKIGNLLLEKYGIREPLHNTTLPLSYKKTRKRQL